MSPFLKARIVAGGSLIAALGILVALEACAPQQVQLTTTDTCQTNAAVVSSLADMRSAGKLTAAQIAIVDKDIAVIDPICSAPTPPAPCCRSS